MNPTAPVGFSAVPLVEVSMTVAVHDDAVFTVTGLVHVIEVEVLRRLTVIVADVAEELALWVVSDDV